MIVIYCVGFLKRAAKSVMNNKTEDDFGHINTPAIYLTDLIYGTATEVEFNHQKSMAYRARGFN